MGVPGNFGRCLLPEDTGHVIGGAEQKSYKLKSALHVLTFTRAA